MTETHRFEEEEFTGTFSGKVVQRILVLVKPYGLWVLGFVVTIAIVSVLDSYFTYLSKRIIDEGIGPGNIIVLREILSIRNLTRRSPTISRW